MVQAKGEKDQTPEIQQQIYKRETQLQEARNSLAKINALDGEKDTGKTGNESKNDNNFLIGGGVLLAMGLLLILIIKKQRRKNKI